MKRRLFLALIASAAATGTASAADLASKPYVKAPALASAGSWTGFYVFGGAGGGLWNADSNAVSDGTLAALLGPSGTPITRGQRVGGSGWFGTVGLGYDWQFDKRWVAGVFADGQFGDI